MSNTSPTGVYDPTEHFSQFQLNALADWAKGMTDLRLGTVQKQLTDAIEAYDPSKDVALVGLALAARSDAVNKEIESRGGVARRSGLIVPWGKSTVDVEKWSLTDYTKLPPPEERGIVVQTEEKPLRLLLEEFKPEGPRAAQEYDPNDNHPVEIGNTLPGDNINIKSNDSDNVLLEADEYKFVKVIDLVNDDDEAESYRMADNDFSGMPIISSEIIDVDNFSQPLEDTFFTADDSVHSLNEDIFHTAMEDPMDLFIDFNAGEPSETSQNAPEWLEQSQQPLPVFDVYGDAQIGPVNPGDEIFVELIDPKSLRTEWATDSPN